MYKLCLSTCSVQVPDTMPRPLIITCHSLEINSVSISNEKDLDEVHYTQTPWYLQIMESINLKPTRSNFQKKKVQISSLQSIPTSAANVKI
jgi:hypothetical protein